MTKIVFCDVEGTLLSASFPGIVLAQAQRMGTLSLAQRMQAGAFGVLGHVLPGGAGRTAQMLGVIRAVAGTPIADLDRVIDASMPTVLAALKPSMVARLRAHMADGYELVLLSAGMHAGIVRLAETLGGRGEGTKLRLNGDRYTGQLDGAICQGRGKAARAEAILRERGADPAACIAYGDTSSDAIYLALMGHPHAVDPDAKLTSIATERGWPIIRTRDDAPVDLAPLLAATPAAPDAPLTDAAIEAQAQEALRQFVTPRRTPLRAKEEALLADASTLTFANGLVAAAWGAGPTVLLLHGWEGRNTNWAAFIPPLVAAGYRVVAPDGPAHGASPGETTDPRDFALRLVEMGRELGPLAGIIAHSMGGASTMLAVSMGLAVERVVIISAPSALFGVVRRFAAMQELPPPVAERFFDLMRARTGVPESAMDVATVARDITIPGLIFHDPADAEVPFADAQATAAAWHTAQLRIIEGRGHRRILLAPEVISEAVAFLGSPVPSRQVG